MKSVQWEIFTSMYLQFILQPPYSKAAYDVTTAGKTLHSILNQLGNAVWLRNPLTTMAGSRLKGRFSAKGLCMHDLMVRHLKIIPVD